jgi:Mrp family chromosome partitioning ATPase
MGRRGLIVAGASSGVGVSFVAANLAVALSQMEISTVLVDANLHHPSIDAYFPHADAEIGLQQHLRSPDVGFADVVQRDILHRLSVVFSGGPAGDASELLLSDRFRSFVEQCLREFECTIIDTPAANRSSDAGLVGSIVGYALLVGRRSVSYIGDLEQLTGELAKDRVEVIGGVLNGA